MIENSQHEILADGVAIIGMAGRFPGARNVNEFWQNLCNGVESIAFFSDEELKEIGIDEGLLSNPKFVKAKGMLEGIELFDAGFFGITPREAEIMDPQHRIFLENAWDALEDAGYDSSRYDGAIGVFAGVGVDTYALFNLFSNPEVLGGVSALQTSIRNRTDHLTTQVSYKLNLKGPGVTVQTACSTSLVAVHLACQSLLNGECDMTLAGGVSISVPEKGGYLYQEGGILSPDGHCRAFDAQAKGTIGGNGVGLVVLKRLEDALADGDTIAAVIRGSALNNDGSIKVGYTAPGVDGQTEVITEALAVADVDPETVTYIEAHGTGTPLGDPIEMEALTRAFQAHTDQTNFCAIGAVKSNVGHLDTAAGITGLIKTALSVKHGQIPPSLHYTEPNPAIDFESSPFYVNTELQKWAPDGTPRRAGVSSFGIGGTNVHVVLEQAPQAEKVSGNLDDKASGEDEAAHAGNRPWHLLPISAKTPSALERATENLADHLTQVPDINLADVAYTLSMGRQAFGQRRIIVCQDGSAVDALEALDPNLVFTSFEEPKERSVVFMFTGQGSQYVNMGLELYQTEAVFREHLDTCCDRLQPHLGFDLRSLLYPQTSSVEQATERLNQTRFTQPALFAVEYALAQLLISWGVEAKAMIGHSIGEYVAACLAGVFTLDDALHLVAERGRLMQEMPEGDMLSIALAEEQVLPLLNDQIALAAVNGTALCVVSGPAEAIDQLEGQLKEEGIGCRRLHTSHAFHSQMMEPMLATFTQKVSELKRSAPTIPFISNVTGTWITDEEAVDPSYWAAHLRQTVRFEDGLSELVTDPDLLLVEVGPGWTLMSLARWHPKRTPGQTVLNSLLPANDDGSDVSQLLVTLGRLWLAGMEIDWEAFFSGAPRKRIPLPTYPFERKRYWVEPNPDAFKNGMGASAMLKKPDMADWFYTPSWKRSAPVAYVNGQLNSKPQEDISDQSASNASHQEEQWLVFADSGGLGAQVVAQLHANGQKVSLVTIGTEFSEQISTNEQPIFTICPNAGSDYDLLVDRLRQLHRMPTKVVHLWSLENHWSVDNEARSLLENSFYSLLYMAQAIGPAFIELGTDDSPLLQKTLEIAVITNSMQDVLGGETQSPEQATVIGPCRSITKEYPGIICRSIDLDLNSLFTNVAVNGNHQNGANQNGTHHNRARANGSNSNGTSDGYGTIYNPYVKQILSELTSTQSDSGSDSSNELVVAYRGLHRWVQTFEPVPLNGVEDSTTPPKLRENGVYLITGGLGGIGLEIAQHLAETVKARIVLTGRSAFPEREQWAEWLATYGEDDEVSQKIRKLESYEESGADVRVFSADVTEINQMRSVVERTHEIFGPINGLIHAAGVGGGGLIQLKSAEMADDVLAPKVKGTRVLESVLSEELLDFWVLCSSRASILGGFGQVDYCAANAFLDAFAHYKNAQMIRNGNYSTPTISINWAGWEEVGMRVETLAQLESRPAQQTASPTEDGEQPDAIFHPLLERRIEESPERTVYLTEFNIQKHWILDDHRILKRAVIPGVAYVEMALAALNPYADGRAVELRDIFFLSVVDVRDDESKEVRTTVTKIGTDQYSFRMQSRLPNADGEEPKWLDNAIGEALILDDGPAIQHDLDAFIARCDQEDYVVTGIAGTHDDLGPRWQNMRRTRMGENEMVNTLELSQEFLVDLERYLLHPAMLDRTNGSAKGRMTGTEAYLPMGYRSLTFRAPLPRKVYAYHRFREDVDPTRETINFDVIIMDEDGTELVNIDSFSQKRVNVVADSVKSLAGGPSRGESDGAGQTQKPNPIDGLSAEEGGQPTSSQSASSQSANTMLSKEGVEAFIRILASQGLSQVITSPNDFLAAVERSKAAKPMLLADDEADAESSRPAHERPAIGTEYVAPRTDLEQRIAEIWQATLGIEEVGVNDNFFDLGGDSVVGIQMIAKFNRAGFQVTPQQLFQYQTVAELAAVLGGDDAATTEVDQTEFRTGSVPLVPAQLRFLVEAQEAPALSQRILRLQTQVALDPALLQSAIRQLVSHHDVFRLRFEQRGTEWHQFYAPPPETTTSEIEAEIPTEIPAENPVEKESVLVPFSALDLSTYSVAEQERLVESSMAESHSNFDLNDGPLVNFTLFEYGRKQELLIAIHPLIADSTSWSILLADLAMAYEQLASGKPVVLPAQTDSFKQWATTQAEAAAALSQEALGYWIAEEREEVVPLPVDFLDAFENSEETPADLNALLGSLPSSLPTIVLSTEETKALLDVATAYHAQVDDLLLTALVKTFVDWTGDDYLLVNMAQQARHLTDLNLAQTVGPLGWELPALLQTDEDEGLDEMLKSIKEQVRTLPNGGMDYGYLRYLNEDKSITERLESQTPAEVRFRFEENVAQTLAESPIFAEQLSMSLAMEPLAEELLLALDATMTEGKLGLTWSYRPQAYKAETVEELAEEYRQRLRDLVEQCNTSDTAGHTPSDFGLANVNQQQLDGILAKLQNTQR